MSLTDERLTLFWDELTTQCNDLGIYEFEYSVEYWGILWMPWFISAGGNPLKFTANDISADDLRILKKIGYIEFLKELEPRDTMDISRETYVIKRF